MNLSDKKNISFYLIPLAILLVGLIIGSIIFINKKYSTGNQSESSEATGLNILKPKVGDNAPLFSLKTSRGVEIALKDLRGQNVLLVFWSTTCQFCAEELAELKEFTDKYRGQIAVLAIGSGETYQTVKEYEEKEKINFTFLVDLNGQIAQNYYVEGTPAHFLINREGKIIALQPSGLPLIGLESLLENLKD